MNDANFMYTISSQLCVCIRLDMNVCTLSVECAQKDVDA